MLNRDSDSYSLVLKLRIQFHICFLPSSGFEIHERSDPDSGIKMWMHNTTVNSYLTKFIANKIKFGNDIKCLQGK